MEATVRKGAGSVHGKVYTIWSFSYLRDGRCDKWMARRSRPQADLLWISERWSIPCWLL
jgi:hypothetical protein